MPLRAYSYFANTKSVDVNYRTCNKTLGPFEEFKRTDSRRNWASDMNKMDWNINFSVDLSCDLNQRVSCDCRNPLGKMINTSDVLFDRRSLKISIN